MLNKYLSGSLGFCCAVTANFLLNRVKKICLPLQLQMIFTNMPESMKRKILQSGDDAYCIVPSNYCVDVKAIYTPQFETILPPQTAEQKRNGIPCRNFCICWLKNYVAKQNPRAQ